MTEFITALQNWIINGSEPKEVIFRVIDDIVERFITRLEFYNETINLRSFKDSETYRDYLSLQFFETKLMKEGGFNYILRNCTDDTAAKKTLLFLLKQINNRIGIEANPEIGDLIEMFKDTMKLLADHFEITKSKKEELYSLKGNTKFTDLEQLIRSSKKRNKELRIRLVNIVLEFLSANGRQRKSQIIQNLKTEFGLSDVSVVQSDSNEDEEEIDTDTELSNFSYLNSSVSSEDGTSVYSKLEKDQFSPSFSEVESEQEIKMKLSKFIDGLEEPELLLLVNWLKIKFNSNDNGENESVLALSERLNMKNSTLYNKLNAIIKKFSSFLSNFDEEERLFIIENLKPLILGEENDE